MRTTPIAPGEHYHILNRGNSKQAIFLDTRDWARFLFLIIHFQSPMIFQNISRHISHFVQNRALNTLNSFNISESDKEKIAKERRVELTSFSLMPNHFHLSVYELESGGIANYMQRVLCAYTKYFNTKYERSGHLFQGPYKAVRIESSEQLLYLSSYIHKNPRELPEWKNREHLYPWSSYQDYVEENRWGKLLQQDIILKQFKNKKEYHHFVKSSPAKEIKENLNGDLLVDLTNL